ncbi:Carboxy-terminal processing protease CtpA [Usitatibacter rugosus]|uniref:Carboxy-terminal processing protease CtpA n=1 Tax=Usitatibacter rugosus TaxID=2732067 RepID=A0A6M4H0T9_9PROT|nr:S41 family peptidase [Usitatibacter rugosus]QJR12952.1 Carboxy-terminal processing protease CtpA [Usitatibacter rugosus]
MTRTILVAIALLPGFAEAAADPPPTDMTRIFNESVARIRTDYVDVPSDQKLIGGCVSGMVAALDRYSSYIDKEKYDNLLNPKQTGVIGIEVRDRDGLIEVLTPFEGSAAARGGILAGDVIVRIDAKPVTGLPLDEIIRLLRGDKGSRIKIAIVREGEAKAREFDLEREAYSPPIADGRLLAGNIAYVRLARFSPDAMTLLADQLKKLDKEAGSNVRGLVLDLRGNTGGLLPVSIGIAAAFLPTDAPIAELRGRSKDVPMSLTAKKSNYVRGAFAPNPYEGVSEQVRQSVPLVVLVNGYTSSGAEIVAGALQDNKRAIVVGSNTAGIGTIQTLLPLGGNDGVLKLTTARYLTPKLRSFDGKGLVPDIVVEGADRRTGERDAVLERALQQLPPLKAAQTDLFPRREQ